MVYAPKASDWTRQTRPTLFHTAVAPLRPRPRSLPCPRARFSPPSRACSRHRFLPPTPRYHFKRRALRPNLLATCKRHILYTEMMLRAESRMAVLHFILCLFPGVADSAALFLPSPLLLSFPLPLPSLSCPCHHPHHRSRSRVCVCVCMCVLSFLPKMFMFLCFVFSFL